ncbi:MAG: SprT family zinc-dependent metalloprotease [Dehalococcoidia bacterium]
MPRTIEPEQARIEVDGATIAYSVIRSRRRRRTIEITVRPGEGVRVSAPAFASRGEVAAVVAKRAGWILARLGSLAQPAPAPTAADTVPFRGEQLSLLLEPGVEPRAFDGMLRLAVEPGSPEPVIPDALRAWYLARANELIPATVAAWAERMGVTPRVVLVRDQRRRWGSCAADGTLRLNWRLVLLPPRAVDYVAVHELAHLRHHDHSPAFWNEVARWLPDWRERRQMLREGEAAFLRA